MQIINSFIASLKDINGKDSSKRFIIYASFIVLTLMAFVSYWKSPNMEIVYIFATLVGGGVGASVFEKKSDKTLES